MDHKRTMKVQIKSDYTKSIHDKRSERALTENQNKNNAREKKKRCELTHKAI